MSENSRTRARRWCFTINNWTKAEYDLVIALECKYLIVAKEVGESGTPHLQGFIIFNKQYLRSTVSKWLPRAFLTPAKGSDVSASGYCRKQSTPPEDIFEKGVFEKGQGKRSDLEEISRKITEGVSEREIALAYPGSYMRYYRGIAAFALKVQEPYEHDDVRGEWYVGLPGTGKSRFAREQNPGAYLKPQNKWFDGYEGQKVIILDDFDDSGIALGHHLKIWADRYSCTGETKGGTVHLRHQKFIITSNFTIEQLWSDREEIKTALLRRFKVKHFGDHVFNPYKKPKVSKPSAFYSPEEVKLIAENDEKVLESLNK